LLCGVSGVPPDLAFSGVFVTRKPSLFFVFLSSSLCSLRPAGWQGRATLGNRVCKCALRESDLARVRLPVLAPCRFRLALRSP